MYPALLSLASLEVLRVAGAPSNGTNEVQRLTPSGSPTGGTFDLWIPGSPDQPGVQIQDIAYNSTMATLATNLATAINAILGANTVSAAAGVGYVDVTFKLKYAAMPVGVMELRNNQLSGGTNPSIGIAVQTAGVLATGRGYPNGTLCWDVTNMILYANCGDANTLLWGPVSGRLTGAGAPTDGVTGAGIIPPGGIYTRTSNGAIYTNTGTLASPTWTVNAP